MTRLLALALALATAVLAACGGRAPDPPPASGLLLLDLAQGGVRGTLSLGADPLAVALSPDGRTAYVSDNAPGAVDAVSLPDLRLRWSTRTGGRPAGYRRALITGSVASSKARATGASRSRRSRCWMAPL